MGKKIKLGSPIFDNPFFIEAPLAASQAFKCRSGHFVYLTRGVITIADSGDGEIWGWGLVGKDWTCSAVSAADKITVCTDPYKVWEVPARDTFTAANLAAYLGDTCDLEISSDIQYVDNGESNEDVVVVVGGDVEEQTLYVHMNPLKAYQTGIA